MFRDLCTFRRRELVRLNLQRFDEPPTDPPTDPPADPPKDDKKYSDADLDKIIAEKFKKWADERDKKIDEAKKEAERLANLNAEDREKELKKKIADLEAEKALEGIKAEARKMLSEAKAPIDDTIVNFVVVNDAEQTKKNVEAFSKAFTEAVDAGIKEALKQDPPKTGSNKETYTKEEILAVTDTNERQRLMNEHKDLFIMK